MKFSNKLNEFDILDLLNEYHSELRKLKYKTEYVKKKVSELEEHYETVKLKKGRVRPEYQPAEEAVAGDQTQTSVVAEKKKRGRPAKPKVEKTEVKKRKPYPLSIWDNMILGSIEEAGKAQLSKSIIEAVKVKASDAGIFETEEKLRSKINQCLVKLTNKRHDLKKVNYKGKGFGYALPVWYDDRGKLRKEFGLK
jgi:hypothetical protein